MSFFKTIIYEVALYSNGSVTPELKIWNLVTKVRIAEEKKKRKQKKQIYLHLDERKAA
jgi:hypothetical protein